MSVGIHDGEGYTIYRGSGDSAEAYNLSGKYEGIQYIRIDDDPGGKSNPNSIRIEVSADRYKTQIESVLHEAEIPFTKGQSGNRVRIANTAEEIAAYRLGVWAEKNLTTLKIKAADRLNIVI